MSEYTKQNEGCKLKVFRCTAGKWTIGWGCNLEDKGITQQIADLIFDIDYEECRNDLKRIEAFNQCNKARQTALLDMRFQMGGRGVRLFRDMWKALGREDYIAASKEVLFNEDGTKTPYYKQTPGRAERNARIIRTGKMPS